MIKELGFTNIEKSISHKRKTTKFELHHKNKAQE